MKHPNARLLMSKLAYEQTVSEGTVAVRDRVFALK